MSDLSHETIASPPSASENARFASLWLVLPVIALAAAIAWLIAANPLRTFDIGAPPVENLTFERIIL